MSTLNWFRCGILSTLICMQLCGQESGPPPTEPWKAHDPAYSGRGLPRAIFSGNYDAAGHFQTEAIRHKLYDSRGHVRMSLESGASTNVQERYFYTYNPQGNLLTELWENANSPGSNRVSHEYDAAGKLLRSRWYIRDSGAPKETMTHTRDPNGRLLRTIWILGEGPPFPPGLLITIDYSYDQHGRMVKRIFDDPPFTDVFTCEYDEAGRLLTTLHEHVLLSVLDRQRAKYSYDAAGRLATVTAQVEVLNGEPHNSEVAILTYAYRQDGKLDAFFEHGDVHGLVQTPYFYMTVREGGSSVLPGLRRYPVSQFHY